MNPVSRRCSGRALGIWILAAVLLIGGGAVVFRARGAAAPGFSDEGLAEEAAVAHFDAEIDDAGAAWKSVAFGACRSKHVRVRQAAALLMSKRISRTAADRDVFDALVALASQDTEDTGPRWCALTGAHRVAPKDPALVAAVARIRADPAGNADLIRLIDRALR